MSTAHKRTGERAPSSPPTTCTPCGAVYDAHAFELLPFKGTETLDGSLFEFRRCACGCFVRVNRGLALGLIA